MNPEPIIRLGFFLGIFAVMLTLEAIAPYHPAQSPQRRLSNIGLLILGTVLLRACFPFAAVSLAELAYSRGWGVMNALAAWHLATWQAVILSIILLDLIVYLNHVLFHALPMLWRLHKVHHADPAFDVTTGLRFHPLELFLSMLVKLGAVLLLGPPVLAVLIFEILLNATSMFNHGNIKLPQPLEHWLRLIVVTPTMHRLHHSTNPRETNSNYGFNLPWWDYLLGTYRTRPTAANGQAIKIGLIEYQRDRRVTQLHWMLILPFLKPPHSSSQAP